MPPEPKYLTPPEVGRLLGMKPESVIDRIRAGELHAVDLARKGSRRPRFRVSPQALADWLLRRSVVAPVRRPRRDATVKSFV